MNDDKEKSFEEKRAALLKGLASKDGVTEIAIKNVYGPHAMAVIWDLVEQKEGAPSKKKKDAPAKPPAEGKRSRSAPRPLKRYSAAETTVLPTMNEFRAALNKKYTITARSLVEDAYSVIEDLAGEAREIVDGASNTGLENTQRIQTFSETADTLEDLSIPDLPDVFDEVEVVRLPTISNATGRAHRMGEALSDMQLACDEVEKWLEDKKQSGEAATEDEDEKEELDESEIESAIKDIRDAVNAAEGVEFPGMYG